MIPPHAALTKEAIARWMGYETVAELDRDHDRLHVALCRWLGVESHSMLCAEGRPHDGTLAALEEDAVLHLTRFAVHAGAEMPT